MGNYSSAVAAGRGGREHMPPGASSKGAPKKGYGFLRHEIYKNSVHSVEAGMDREGKQILYIKQCTF